MALPSDFGRLSVPEQLFVAIDRERVDRGLAPFAGLTTTLNAGAQQGADAAQLPPRPGQALSLGGHGVDRRRRQRARRRLPMDVRRRAGQRRTRLHGEQDRRVAGSTGISSSVGSGARDLVMGAAYDPTATPRAGTGEGPLWPPRWPPPATPAAYSYTWKQALASMAAGTAAAAAGDLLDGVRHRDQRSPPQRGAGARLHADCCAGGDRRLPVLYRRRSGCHQPRPCTRRDPPMVLPADFAQLSMPDQLFVAVNLERVDRGLPTFGGLTTALDQQRTTWRGHGRRPTRSWVRPTTSTMPSGLVGRPTGSMRSTAGCTTTATTAATSTASTAALPDAGATARASSTTSAPSANVVMGAAIAMTRRHPPRRQGRHVHGRDARRRRRARPTFMFTWTQVVPTLPPRAG